MQSSQNLSFYDFLIEFKVIDYPPYLTFFQNLKIKEDLPIQDKIKLGARLKQYWDMLPLNIQLKIVQKNHSSEKISHLFCDFLLHLSDKKPCVKDGKLMHALSSQEVKEVFNLLQEEFAQQKK